MWPTDIPELRLKSATNAIAQDVEDGFGGAWRYTIRMGVTPVDDLDSAEAKARWLGAPWLRRPIRRQMGAQLLAGAARDSPQWAHGVLAWTLGGGSQQNLALAYAEPHFNHESADYIVRGVGDSDLSRGRIEKLASVGAEAWDLVSDETLRWLADQIPPARGQGSPAPEGRMIWSAYAIRSPTEWFESYQELDVEVRGALLDSLQPPALHHFSDQMKEAMYGALLNDNVLLAEGGRLIPLAAALAPPEENTRLRQLIESDQPKYPRVITQMIEERPDLISSATEAGFLGKLRDSLTKQSQQALHGTTSLGGPGPRIELGRMLGVTKKVDPRLVDLLVETAADPSLPPQYVTEARQGLVLLRRAGRLSHRHFHRLRKSPEPRAQGPMEEGLTRGVLRVLLLQILVGKLTAAERQELVVAARSSEERIRDIAVNACAEALGDTKDEALAWAVVSGLFDPSDSVSDGALAGLPALTDYFPAAAEVAWQRLPALFDSSPRRVRAQIIQSLEYVTPATRVQMERRRGLMARGRRDRSWLVRDAATQL